MNRFDLLSPRKGKDDKTRWHKIGAAFPRDKGGFQLVFDSLPLPDNEGRVTVMMWEAKPRQDQGGAPAGGFGGGMPDNGMDDQIPFAPWVL